MLIFIILPPNWSKCVTKKKIIYNYFDLSNIHCLKEVIKIFKFYRQL